MVRAGLSPGAPHAPPPTEGHRMATVLDEILDSFYKKLSDSQTIDESTVEALRALFESDKKLKADDFVGILSDAKTETRDDSD